MVEKVIKSVRKTRRTFWNLQRMLGTLTMVLEFFNGQFLRSFKKFINKIIGRNIVRRIFIK